MPSRPRKKKKFRSEPWRPHTRRDGTPKVPYETEDEALYELHLRHGYHSKYTVYCCPICDKWHIGEK